MCVDELGRPNNFIIVKDNYDSHSVSNTINIILGTSIKTNHLVEVIRPTDQVYVISYEGRNINNDSNLMICKG
jgi:hypothetical protein